MKTRQLQIRPVNSKGELGSPSKYPVGCIHKFASGTMVRVYHPDDRTPGWVPHDDESDEDWPPEYVMAYATHSCPHGLVVEYVEVDVPEQNKTV